jgi:hypothetical protein
MTRFRFTVAGLVALVSVAAGPAPASAQSRCTAARYQALGKLGLAEAKCVAKATRKGEPTDRSCTEKASARFGRTWSRSERKGDCEQPGALAGQFARDLVRLLVEGELAIEIDPPSRLCCTGGVGEQCGWVVDEPECTALPATLGAPGTVCDGLTGGCTATPATLGGCCQDLTSFGSCVTGPAMSEAECAGEGGTFFPNALCLPSGSCSPPVGP